MVRGPLTGGTAAADETRAAAFMTGDIVRTMGNRAVASVSASADRVGDCPSVGGVMNPRRGGLTTGAASTTNGGVALHCTVHPLVTVYSILYY